MLDLAWTEIALILLVALVVIGPKDLPHAIKGVADFIKKMRRMAGEFQVHVDEMMRETKLDEVKRQIDEVRAGAYDMKRQFEQEIDPNRDFGKSFADPFAAPAETLTPSATAAADSDAEGADSDAEGPPPLTAPTEASAQAPPPGEPLPAPDEPLAFLPPSAAQRDKV